MKIEKVKMKKTKQTLKTKDVINNEKNAIACYRNYLTTSRWYNGLNHYE